MLPDLHRKLSYCLQAPGKLWPPTETTATVSQGKTLHTRLLPGPTASCWLLHCQEPNNWGRANFYCYALLHLSHPLCDPVCQGRGWEWCWLLQTQNLTCGH